MQCQCHLRYPIFLGHPHLFHQRRLLNNRWIFLTPNQARGSSLTLYLVGTFNCGRKRRKRWQCPTFKAREEDGTYLFPQSSSGSCALSLSVSLSSLLLGSQSLTLLLSTSFLKVPSSFVAVLSWFLHHMTKEIFRRHGAWKACLCVSVQSFLRHITVEVA